MSNVNNTKVQGRPIPNKSLTLNITPANCQQRVESNNGSFGNNQRPKTCSQSVVKSKEPPMSAVNLQKLPPKLVAKMNDAQLTGENAIGWRKVIQAQIDHQNFLESIGFAERDNHIVQMMRLEKVPATDTTNESLKMSPVKTKAVKKPTPPPNKVLQRPWRAGTSSTPVIPNVTESNSVTSNNNFASATDTSTRNTINSVIEDKSATNYMTNATNTNNASSSPSNTNNSIPPWNPSVKLEDIATTSPRKATSTTGPKSLPQTTKNNNNASCITTINSLFNGPKDTLQNTKELLQGYVNAVAKKSGVLTQAQLRKAAVDEANAKNNNMTSNNLSVNGEKQYSLYSDPITLVNEFEQYTRNYARVKHEERVSNINGHYSSNYSPVQINTPPPSTSHGSYQRRPPMSPYYPTQRRIRPALLFPHHVPGPHTDNIFVGYYTGPASEED